MEETGRRNGPRGATHPQLEEGLVAVNHRNTGLNLSQMEQCLG